MFKINFYSCNCDFKRKKKNKLEVCKCLKKTPLFLFSLWNPSPLIVTL